MFWVAYFWIVAALLIAPLPLKLSAYASGKDDSPRGVKVDEMLHAAVFLTGLVGLYGYVYHSDLPSAWKGWVLLAVVYSVASVLWSPRVKYAATRLGMFGARVVIGLGFLVFVPMLVGVWRGAGAG